MSDVNPAMAAVFQRFIEAWNLRDPAERRRVLEETCAPEIEISSPYGHYRGIDKQFDEISQFRKQFPEGHCVSRIVSQHHDSLLQAWTTTFGEVRAPLTGIDCVQFNATGRILRVLSFSPVAAPR
ncbi:MAG: nuclear transport factor 2 family protein [Thermoplasmata archaeon]